MKTQNIDNRLTKIEKEICIIRQMLEELLKDKLSRKKEFYDDEILTVKQISAYLSVDANVIYSKCSKGTIPFFKLGNGYRFRKSNIDAWLKSSGEDLAAEKEEFVNSYLLKNSRRL